MTRVPLLSELHKSPNKKQEHQHRHTLEIHARLAGGRHGCTTKQTSKQRYRNGQIHMRRTRSNRVPGVAKVDAPRDQHRQSRQSNTGPLQKLACMVIHPCQLRAVQGKCNCHDVG